MDFYVYRLFDERGGTQYIGKGSGRRLTNQRRIMGLSGEPIAYFTREADAYAFEIEKIEEERPPLNKHRGGNGNRAVVKKRRLLPEFKEIERLGTRRYAARILLKYAYLFAASEIEKFRQVAHG